MDEPAFDRSDPGVRAAVAVRSAERRQRTLRTIAALALFAGAGAGPFAAEPLVGDPGATVGAVVASLLLAGWSIAIWPWTWSEAEREHHRLGAIWAEARADTGEETPWDRYAAWAGADDDRVELMLITRAGSAAPVAEPSPFASEVVRRLDAEAIGDAASAMEALRADAAEREAAARDRHLEGVAAAAREPYDDALRAVDENADAEQRRAEARMRRDAAEQEAAERRAQAAAVARALRRP
jgi:hypothetical protein